MRSGQDDACDEFHCKSSIGLTLEHFEDRKWVVLGT